MVELSEFIGNFFLELIGLITFYQRSPMDFFYFLIRISVQLHFTIYQFKNTPKSQSCLTEYFKVYIKFSYSFFLRLNQAPTILVIIAIKPTSKATNRDCLSKPVCGSFSPCFVSLLLNTLVAA